MRRSTKTASVAAECMDKDIRGKSCNRYFTEDKNRVVLAGFCGEDRIAELSKQEGLSYS